MAKIKIKAEFEENSVYSGDLQDLADNVFILFRRIDFDIRQKVAYLKAEDGIKASVKKTLIEAYSYDTKIINEILSSMVVETEDGVSAKVRRRPQNRGRRQPKAKRAKP